MQGERVSHDTRGQSSDGGHKSESESEFMYRGVSRGLCRGEPGSLPNHAPGLAGVSAGGARDGGGGAGLGPALDRGPMCCAVGSSPPAPLAPPTRARARNVPRADVTRGTLVGWCWPAIG